MIVALDTASPVVSVAVGVVGGGRAHLLAERSMEIRRSSEKLLPLLDEALAEAGVPFSEVGGVVALRGPGSFTGLRVGLATALGFHQATGVPATALGSLDALVLAPGTSAPGGGRTGTTTGPVAGAVDALRGEWFVQRSAADDGSTGAEEPAILTPEELVVLGVGTVVGFGVGRLADSTAWRDAGPGAPRLFEPERLAPAALELAARRLGPPESWDADLLTRPLYLRAPAVSLPGVPKRVGTGG